MNFSILHLEAEISFIIDFAHVCSLFLGHSDKDLKQKSTIQQKKFNNLLRDKKPQHDPENYFFKLFLFCFIRKEKVSFSEGFKGIHADYFVNFELSYRDIRNLQVFSTEDLDFTKTKSKDITLSSFRTYDSNVPQHLSKGKFDLKTNKSSFKNLTKAVL